jgi:hypothetical protein
MPDVFVMAATSVNSTSTVSLLTTAIDEVALIRSISVYNASTAGTADITISVTLGTAAAETLFPVARFTSVDSLASVQALTQPLVLNTANSLRIQCTPAGTVHAVVSYLRIS